MAYHALIFGGTSLPRVSAEIESKLKGGTGGLPQNAKTVSLKAVA
jgi:hypothetical protein